MSLAAQTGLGQLVEGHGGYESWDRCTVGGFNQPFDGDRMEILIYIYYIIYAIGCITNAMGHMGVSQMGEFIEKIAS
jgi:hypothetical protein